MTDDYEASGDECMCDGNGECFQLERDLNELTDWNDFLCSWIRTHHRKSIIEEAWESYQKVKQSVKVKP